MTPGAGPRRYTCGGHFLSTGQAIALLEEATGYTIRHVPMPAGAMVALGGFSELVHRVAGRVTPFTHDAMVYLTRARFPSMTGTPSTSWVSRSGTRLRRSRPRCAGCARRGRSPPRRPGARHPDPGPCGAERPGARRSPRSIGVEGPEDLANYLLAGADVVTTTSSLLRHGPEHAGCCSTACPPGWHARVSTPSATCVGSSRCHPARTRRPMSAPATSPLRRPVRQRVRLVVPFGAPSAAFGTARSELACLDEATERRGPGVARRARTWRRIG